MSKIIMFSFIILWLSLTACSKYEKGYRQGYDDAVEYHKANNPEVGRACWINARIIELQSSLYDYRINYSWENLCLEEQPPQAAEK